MLKELLEGNINDVFSYKDFSHTKLASISHLIQQFCSTYGTKEELLDKTAAIRETLRNISPEDLQKAIEVVGNEDSIIYLLAAVAGVVDVFAIAIAAAVEEAKSSAKDNLENAN